MWRARARRNARTGPAYFPPPPVAVRTRWGAIGLRGLRAVGSRYAADRGRDNLSSQYTRTAGLRRAVRTAHVLRTNGADIAHRPWERNGRSSLIAESICHPPQPQLCPTHVHVVCHNSYVTMTAPAAASPAAASSASRPREGTRSAAAARPRPPPTGSRSPLVRCAVL